MKLEWRFPKPVEVSGELLAATSGQSLVARVLAGRGMTDPDAVRRFLDPGEYEAAEPQKLHDLPAGVARIQRAIRDGERILVWGDFDVDGQTSTALLVSALTGLGAQVDYHIPIRERESHGIRPDVLRPYIDAGIDLLVSCDTGIASVDAVALANESDVDVVVTDHHDLPAELPAAHALINPKFHRNSEPNHPLRGLPGVGVAYKVVEALYTEAGRAQELEPFLDLVALGIVADLAVQEDDSRYLLQRGMRVLRSTERPGLQELMKNGGVEAEFLNDEDIGFQIGPRLNAVGRLADANVSVPLLTTADSSSAAEIAAQLERLNEERKFQTQVVYDSAIAEIERDPSLLQYAALVMANDHWHQGVIGIVASRLVEEHGKPTILFATAEDGVARGSGRSVEGYHITEAIAAQTELLLGFGGHPMAAGLSLMSADLEGFRRGVSKAIIAQRDGRPPEPTLAIEADLPLGEVTTLATARELEALAPFGPGNPPVNILCRGVEVMEAKEIGKDRTHRKLTMVDDAGQSAEVLWWGGASEPLPEGRLDIVVRVRVGSFRGKQNVTTTLQDLRPAGEAAAVGTDGGAGRVVIDCRGEGDERERKLREILSRETGVQVWGEVARDESMMKTRGELEPGEVLILWTVPADRRVLTEVLGRVNAERVYVFDVDPAVDEYDQFMRRFGGLVKYAIEQYGGESTIADLASAMGHDERAVIQALEVLPALGVEAGLGRGGKVAFQRREVMMADKAEELLQLMLEESCAFRRAFRESSDVVRFFE